MATDVANLIRHRTQALATVFFTARGDVEVHPTHDLGELDQLCRVTSPDEDREALFGVILMGTGTEIRTERHANQSIHQRMSRRKTRKYPFPVLALLFSMQTDTGYAAWVVEPCSDAEGLPKLVMTDDYKCFRANRESLEKIVKDVRRWYADFYEEVVSARSA